MSQGNFASPSILELNFAYLKLNILNEGKGHIQISYYSKDNHQNLDGTTNKRLLDQFTCPFNAYFSPENRQKSAEGRSGSTGDAPVLSPLLFAKKSLNKTGRCAGALS